MIFRVQIQQDKLYAPAVSRLYEQGGVNEEADLTARIKRVISCEVQLRNS